MENINFDELLQLIKKFSSSRAMLTFHSVGDTDAVASALVLSKLFPNSLAVAPDKVSNNVEHILKKIGYKNKISTEFERNSEVIILLDVNNFENCGPFSQKLSDSNSPIIVIDHHSPSKINRDNVYVFNDESYSATASIIYEIVCALKSKLDKNSLELLSLGIISDSAELQNSTALTFKQLGELFELAGTDYSALTNYFFYDQSAERRASIITEIFNSDIVIKNELIFIYGNTGIHPGIVADTAIKIGADVAIFSSKYPDKISFSTRLKEGLDKEYGIDLGRIMKKLSVLIDGSGGGHPCAGGAYGSAKESEDAFIENFILEVLDRVRLKKQK